MTRLGFSGDDLKYFDVTTPALFLQGLKRARVFLFGGWLVNCHIDHNNMNIFFAGLQRWSSAVWQHTWVGNPLEVGLPADDVPRLNVSGWLVDEILSPWYSSHPRNTWGVGSVVNVYLHIGSTVHFFAEYCLSDAYIEIWLTDSPPLKIRVYYIIN